MPEKNLEYGLSQAVYAEFLCSVKSAQGAGSIKELVNEYGFTGMFSGLDKYFSKEKFIEHLESALGE